VSKTNNRQRGANHNTTHTRREEREKNRSSGGTRVAVAGPLRSASDPVIATQLIGPIGRGQTDRPVGVAMRRAHPAPVPTQPPCLGDHPDQQRSSRGRLSVLNPLCNFAIVVSKRSLNNWECTRKNIVSECTRICFECTFLA